MAQLAQEFDAETVAPRGDLDPIPQGKYIVAIIESEWAATKKGDGHMVKLTLEVLEGEYKGRRVWDNLNLANPNQQAVEIAQRTLSSICHACGVLRVKDTSELHNIPMLAKVVVKQEPGYEPRNEVKGYAAVAGAALTPPASTPKPAGTRPAQAPWAKKAGEAA